MSYFTEGGKNRVAWSHAVAPDHTSQSVMRAAAVLAKDALARLGTVQGPANDVATHWEVLLDGDTEPRVLTSDEIVRVEE